jgi:hypothetical protein
MNETCILILLLQMYFTQNWEFGSALQKLKNLEGGLNPQPPSTSVRHWGKVKFLYSRVHSGSGALLSCHSTRAGGKAAGL